MGKAWCMYVYRLHMHMYMYMKMRCAEQTRQIAAVYAYIYIYSCSAGPRLICTEVCVHLVFACVCNTMWSCASGFSATPFRIYICSIPSFVLTSRSSPYIKNRRRVPLYVHMRWVVFLHMGWGWYDSTITAYY